MSRLAYYADFVTMPVLALVLIALGDATMHGVIAGILLWTLAEYVLHRWAFHALPFFKPAHDEHHAKPSGRTGVTSWHSLAVFGGLALVLPAGILAGFVIGYLAYITAHHAVHHWRIAPGHLLYALKLRHNAHHRGVEANFGVVTTVWDRVFGTYRQIKRPSRASGRP
ncbi:sterol desaturase family protein [Methylobacterium brachythecii]|uniref:Fatty acid hydroxylase n=1 Tax=Methylobacterium brachythecii TaxID=1176177 RepID=A0A7W6AM48_9HYPH|nr:sterol desaturase family protein [Methylobacterium brachythecii]MBB3905141.1 sterol desaturase/sphingolipid hydroxylase (fatty acid hydroxylase superfamily) [Methylobacterium brachythecii]GLS44352.1 fatty acid hydroxylase [Methylobacterium brachythecii]